MFGLSISELLNVFWAVIKYAFLAWLGSFVIQWVWRSLIVPIFQRRAYFYIYKVDDEGFYIEKPLRILWHRLWRNKRWALQTALIGYVAKRTGGSESDAGGSSLQAENDIFFTSLSHKTHVGQVKSPAEKTIPGGGKMRICEVILKRSNVEGDKYYDAPVGFINDKGEVFKYYRDRKAALKGQMLQEPVLIGYARAPQLQERKNFPGSYDTDVEAAGCIDSTSSSSEWFFFRKRKKSKVKAQKVTSGTTIKGFIYFWAAGWRVLHAHLAGDMARIMRPWGVGYAEEDFWGNNKAAGFSLDARAVAALLLAEQEGFYLRDAEQGSEGTKGMWPTALLSLVCYLCSFPFLNNWSALEHWFEGLVGPQISKVLALILLFFAIWLVVHTFRMLCYDATDRFESFLYKMNSNVGTSNWNTELIIVSVLGLILSVFVVDYLFFPIFFCALIAIVGQRIVYPPKPWDVDNPFDGFDDEEDGEDDDNVDEKEQDFDEEVEHSATIFTTRSSLSLNFKIPYKKDQLKSLRASNPFRDGNTSEYAERVKQMIEKEYGGIVYSRIKYVKERIERFVVKHHLSYLEKINLILKLSQPENIIYHHDWNSEELLPQWDEPVPNKSLLKTRDDGKDGFGYEEYCRYPTETMYDKRGDCDCHAALAVGLLAACGIRCCYFTNQTNKGTGHAALGIEVNEELRNLVSHKNVFTYKEKTYIYAEATGANCGIGEVPSDFEDMLRTENGGTYAVVEPAVFKDFES